MTVKETLYKACLDMVNDRQVKIQERFAGIQEAMLLETKSSAGDTKQAEPCCSWNEKSWEINWQKFRKSKKFC